MRNGPEYSQWIRHNDQTITIPLELMNELGEYKFIIWKDNKDGTYTLIPTN